MDTEDNNQVVADESSEEETIQNHQNTGN